MQADLQQALGRCMLNEAQALSSATRLCSAQLRPRNAPDLLTCASASRTRGTPRGRWEAPRGASEPLKQAQVVLCALTLHPYATALEDGVKPRGAGKHRASEALEQAQVVL